MSFFEVYNILINDKLKFSRLSMMDDNNEGFGKALESQLCSFGLHFNSTNKDIINTHTHVKNSNYITCWTQEKDSIAMWLLYSKNKNFIRVKTSKEKLMHHADTFLKNNLWSNHLKSESGTLQAISPKCEIGEVEYIDFNDIFFKLNKLHQNQQKSINMLTEKNKNIEFEYNEELTQEMERILSKTYDDGQDLINKALLLKDKAYSFENEVRACLPNLSVRNNLSYNEYMNHKNQYSVDYLTSTINFDYENALPDIVHISIDDNFIEEICFDPRMPKYQQDIYIDILKIKDKVEIVNSNVFGRVTDENNFGMSMLYPKNQGNI